MELIHHLRDNPLYVHFLILNNYINLTMQETVVPRLSETAFSPYSKCCVCIFRFALKCGYNMRLDSPDAMSS